MNYNHEDAVTIRTNGRKNDASALCALRDVLEGKALIYDACTETPHHGLNPSEGITLKLADEPDMGCDMMITFLPYLSDDGRALLKSTAILYPTRMMRTKKLSPRHMTTSWMSWTIRTLIRFFNQPNRRDTTMIDIYMNGAEVHAETPEEEREASLILSAALSGKTIPAGGCICPDQRDSTVGKGITVRFCDGTDMTITPTSDAEGNPELEICCSMEAVIQEVAEEPTYYYEVRLEPKPVLRSYIAAAYELCNELTDSELVQMGHDRNTGRIRLLQALETVDALADYSEEAAPENYMDVNFPNVTFKPEFVNPRAARWCGM